MRKIKKGKPVEDFVDFDRHKKTTEWSASKDRSPIWRKHILEVEQEGLSGYTESPVRFDTSHIDHFRKRALFPMLTYSWMNYVVDSKDSDYGACFKDNKVSTVEDYNKLIDPCTENAQEFFQYELNGLMIPAMGLSDLDRQKAQFTIDTFNLNHRSLVERRADILRIDFNAYEGLSPEEVVDALKSKGFLSVVEQALCKNQSNDDDQEK